MAESEKQGAQTPTCVIGQLSGPLFYCYTRHKNTHICMQVCVSTGTCECVTWQQNRTAVNRRAGVTHVRTFCCCCIVVG